MNSLCTLVVAGCCAALPVTAGGLRAGFATADITPRPGLEMGGFGYNLGRTGDAIHDRLLARAAVLDLDGKRMAIIGCDLGGMSPQITRAVRDQLEAAGIPAHAVMLGTTHTHSAPVVANWLGVGKRDPAYLAELPSKITGAVREALGKLEPVSIGYGEAAVEGVARNREYPDGPVDAMVRVLKFTSPGGQVAGFIANYSVHPVVMAEKTRMYTGDLAGVSTNKIMAENAGAVGIFLQGSCGDINPIYAHMPQEESLGKLELLATRLASSMSAALKSSSPVKVERIRMQNRSIRLPLVPPQKAQVIDRLRSAEAWLKQPDLSRSVAGELEFRRESARAVLERFHRQPLTEWTTEVQAAILGDVVIAANPGETFLTFGEKTAAALAGHKVLVTGYTNDYVGYIPAPDRYQLDDNKGLSYPAYLTPWINGQFRFREDVGDVLVREMVSLAREVLSSTGATGN